ncbi:MAG TPA: hypothetical protein VHG28_02260 [Longimicrobiaceae bacterium]|nr:hypothetical protein [Longimicrobiaceae bacterium]
MARIPIDEMEPGGTLDELVARRVLGWSLRRPCPGEIVRMPGGWRCRKCGKTGPDEAATQHPELPPRSSTNIGTAWKILEALAREGARVEVSANRPERGPEPWCAVIVQGEREYRAGGETAALAICRAALKAREG